MTKVTFFRRLCMIILFIGAFYSTIIAVSNLTISDVYNRMTHDDLIETPTFDRLSNKVVTWSTKNMIPEKLEANKAHSREKEFEKIMDLDQYPKKNVLATGYTAGVESTGKTESHPEYGITFSGVEVKRDIYSTIAADLDVFPLGTILYIPDYGYGVVADKGSAITGNKIDLYYPTVQDVFTNWGKKEVDIYVVELGDGTLTEETLTNLNNDESLEVFRNQIMNNE